MGCGVTRAVMHMHHLEVKTAFQFNRGVILVYLALVVTWFIWVVKAARQLGLLKKFEKKRPLS